MCIMSLQLCENKLIAMIFDMYMLLFQVHFKEDLCHQRAEVSFMPRESDERLLKTEYLQPSSSLLQWFLRDDRYHEASKELKIRVATRQTNQSYCLKAGFLQPALPIFKPSNRPGQHMQILQSESSFFPFPIFIK